MWSVEEMEHKIKENPDMVCLSSHYFRHFPKEVCGRRLLYFCFVREPLDWLISNFTYVKNNARNFSKSHMECFPANAEDLNLRVLISKVISTDQTWPQRGQWLTRIFSQNASCESNTRNSLEAAKDVLSSFSFVGTTARFEDSFHAFRKFLCGFGYDLCHLPSPNENVSADFRIDLDWLNPADEVGKMIFEKLRVDFELYNFAREVADKHIKQHSAVNPVCFVEFFW